MDNLEMTQTLLEIEGFQVQRAKDAETALKILETCRPSLILMDIQLPGMDGLELTRHLGQHPSWRGIIILALSAYGTKSDEDNSQAAGCDGYITKPINTPTFAATVRGYLETASRSLRP